MRQTELCIWAWIKLVCIEFDILYSILNSLIFTNWFINLMKWVKSLAKHLCWLTEYVHAHGSGTLDNIVECSQFRELQSTVVIERVPTWWPCSSALFKLTQNWTVVKGLYLHSAFLVCTKSQKFHDAANYWHRLYCGTDLKVPIMLY